MTIKRLAPRSLALVAIGFALAATFPGSSLAVICTGSVYGPFVNQASGPNPLYAAVGDFNHDGRLDLAVTNSDFPNGGGGSSLAIFLATGPRTYAAPAYYAVALNPHMVTTGDFNGDGILDLVVANKFSSNLSVLLGQGSGGVGNGTFAPGVLYPTGGFPFQIVVHDFNHDGISDLAVSLNNTAAVALLAGLGSGGVGNGTFGPAVPLPLASASTGLEHGDWNGDGIEDLVATEDAAGSIAVLLGTGSAVIGTGSFGPAAHFPAGPFPFEFATGDFNSDGKTDLAVANNGSGSDVRVMLGNGSGGFAPATIVLSTNSASVAADDVNGDGILDLVVGTVTGFNGGDVKVLTGLGSGGIGNGAFGLPVDYAAGGDSYQVLPVDLDGDGHRDLVVTQYLNTSISLLWGTCSTDPHQPVLTSVRDVPHDQGGRLFLTWTASSLDATGGSVNSYRVWRRIPPATVATLTAKGGVPASWMRNVDAATADVVYWEALATLPAQRIPGYGYTAATTQDSIAGSNPYTAFFITALTSSIDVFYSSNVDSSYSVDNIPPSPPSAVTANVTASQVTLHWAAVPDPDFAQYRVYRGASGAFVPGADNQLMASENTTCVDASPGAATSYYKISALDKHGNESAFVLVSPSQTTGVVEPPLIALALRGPNPARGEQIPIDLALPAPGDATLEIADVAGRVIARFSVGLLGSGRHAFNISRTSLPGAGVYFLRLTQGGHQVRDRMVVLQ